MATKERQRARRIAADEAHAWARNLRLNNAAAKLTLSMLTLYVDGDGYCFVSLPTLSEDTELSVNTVRNRLAWLEEIGAINRLPQWIDERGNRTSDPDAKGRRTSDRIRLMIDVAGEDIEANAAAKRGVSREVSPPSGGGLNPEAETVSPPLGLQRPSNYVEGLISEPEPESSPLPPSRGRESEDREQDLPESEPEHFEPAWQGWRGHEVMRRDLALAEFRKLDPDKQQLCRAAVPLFWALQDRLKRTTVPNFHTWIRSGGFNEFPTATLEPRPSASSYDASGPEARALRALYRFAHVPLFEHAGQVVYRLPVTAQVLAFGSVPPETEWHWIEDRAQLAAWSTFLSAHIARARPSLVQEREGKRGHFAPWPWPPRKDGTISPIAEQGETE